MSGKLSPEEQKNIILERMEEKRRHYRESFIKQFPVTSNTTALLDVSDGFPRSHTFKLILQYPYLIGFALAAAVVMLVNKRSRYFVSKKFLGITDVLVSKLKMLIVPTIVRLFRSYISR